MTRIQASLSILKCTLCHSRDVLRDLVLKTEDERLEIIRTMQEKHLGMHVTKEEARRIQDSDELVLGMRGT